MLYNDESINEEAEGVVNRNHLVHTVVGGIKRLSANGPSSVTGLTGPWGSGKTSLLLGVERHLNAVRDDNDNQEWKVVRHTPWMFNSYETAASGLYSELMATLPDGQQKTDLKKQTASFLDKVAPVGIVGRAVGIDGMEAIRDISKSIYSELTPTELMGKLSTAFKSTSHSVLVIMDDLDRLHPEELLSVFKLVRLLGRIPKVHYILAYDEESLLGLLSQTDVTRRNNGRAQEYLEKIVQLRMDIPPLTFKQRTDLINYHLEELYSSHDMTLAPEQEARLDKLWADHLVKRCEQPRTIKRLISTVDSLWRSVQFEVDFVDFLAMTYVRLHMNDFYATIYRNRGLLFETRSLSFSLKREDPLALWQRWDTLIQQLESESDIETAQNLSTFLFPALSYAQNNIHTTSRRDIISSPKKVGNPLYFERYYQNSVLENDVSDSAIDMSLDFMRQGRNAVSSRTVKYLLDNLIAQPHITIPRLESRAELPHFPILPFLNLASIAYEEKESASGTQRGDGEQYVWLALNILEKTNPFSASIYTRMLLAGEDTRAFALDYTYRASSGDRDWLDLLETEVDKYARIYIRKSLRNGNYLSSALIASLYQIYHSETKESVHAFAWRTLRSSPEWSFWKLLAVLTPAYPPNEGSAFYGDDLASTHTALDSLLGYENVSEHVKAIVEDRQLIRLPITKSSEIDAWRQRGINMVLEIDAWKVSTKRGEE